MLRLSLCIIAFAAVAALMSCGSALPGTCHGAGGSGGGAGNTSTGAIGGQSGAGMVGSWRQLSCVTALLAECPLEGSCTRQQLDGGGNTLTTFASGVTVSYQDTGACDFTTDGIRTYEVRRSDGSVCFSKQGSVLHTFACERGDLTIRDGNGETVASGSLTGTGSTLACSKNAESCGGTGGIGGADCDPPLDVSCATGACL